MQGSLKKKALPNLCKDNSKAPVLGRKSVVSVRKAVVLGRKAVLLCRKAVALGRRAIPYLVVSSNWLPLN